METSQLNAITAQIADMEDSIRRHGVEFSELKEKHRVLKTRVDSLELGSNTMHNQNLARFDKINAFIVRADPFLTEIMGERDDKKAVREWFNRCVGTGKRMALSVVAIGTAIGVCAGLVSFVLGHIK